MTVLNDESDVSDKTNADFLLVADWGQIRCSECDEIVCYFPPEVKFNDHHVLPFYCFQCSVALSSKGN